MTPQERIDRARAQVGYRALPLKTSAYGQSGVSWDGAFVESITGLQATSTNALLQRFVQSGRLYAKPKAGDIAFFGFSTDGEYGQVHVGVVTEVGKAGEFRCVEGMTASGKPRESNDENGVHERMRFLYDVIGFGRGDMEMRVWPVTGRPIPTIRAAEIQYGRRHKSVEYIQQALGLTVGLTNVTRGTYDSRTKAAYALFERRNGVIPATGLPTTETLWMLKKQTGLFHVNP